MATPITRSLAASTVTVGLVLGLAACSSSPDDEAVDGDIVVAGSDYGFDVTGDVRTGATLTFTNTSDVEFHELVLLRLADGEERSVAELLELPEDEAGDAMTFVGVAAAGPGEEGRLVDGSLTLDEPGRYVLTCFIPEGADPDMANDAFFGGETPDGPPQLGDGTPHAMLGMLRELTVEG